MNTDEIQNISAGLRHLAIPIDSVSSDPANCRTHGQRNLEIIQGSLRAFGQQTPIVIDSRKIIRKGNGTWQAAKALGWTHIAAVVSDLNDIQLTSYSVADNRAGETSQWDQQSLADVLAALQTEDANLSAAAGYSPDELAALLGAGSDNPDPGPPEDFQTVDESIQTDHQCPKCGYRWSGSTAPQGAD